MMSTLTRLSRWSPLLAGLALVGCNTTATVPDPSDPELVRVSSCGDLRDYMGDVLLESLVESRYGWGYWRDDVAEGDGAPSDGGGGPSDFTTTNTQEEGVDEVDLVKTDGKYLYIAQDRDLHIVKSWPVEDSEKLSTLALEGWVTGLFLKGDKVVVFHHPESARDGMSWGTRITVVDVKDRSEPKIEREIDVEGYMADGRMIDGDVYVVFNHWLELPYEAWELLDGRIALPEMDYELEGEALEAHREKVRAEAREILRPHVDKLVRDMDLADVLPQWRDAKAGKDAEPELMHGCSDLYHPKGLAQHGALSIVNLDVDDGDLSAAGILSNGWQLYASKENVYVAQNSGWWWWGSVEPEVVTHIHKFELKKDGEPAYTASGEVSGWAYDQFAFSEYDGHLRVATTDQAAWWRWGMEEDADRPEPANNVFVMKQDGATLDIVGEIRGIAPNERIFATRFFGDVGYMVTFEQIDPLFTLDLKNPEKPKVVGELKIPGYSAYLHPMSEGYLLAVGMDGDDEGNLSGLAFNVFDVRDLKNPTLAHQYTVEGSDWSWSEALWDHHAFTYHRDVLSVPMYSWYDDRGDDGWFSGIISLKATEDGISEIGRIDHRSLVRDSECLYARWYDWEDSVCDYDYWYASVRRSVYIEDNLFSISNYGVRVTDLNNPRIEHARVLFYPEIR
jgi:uncharacterized secreted protein with C-terminal beta-propeller domain